MCVGDTLKEPHFDFPMNFLKRKEKLLIKTENRLIKIIKLSWLGFLFICYNELRPESFLLKETINNYCIEIQRFPKSYMIY